MQNTKRNWNTLYQEAECVWGTQPDHLLLKYAPQIPDGAVLDLGVGEGRNALFFAMKGHKVHGIDISQAAVEKCLERARQAGLSMTCEVDNLINVKIEPVSQALIVSTMTLQCVKKSESAKIISRMKQGVMPGGMVYITVFSTEDPSYEKLKQTQKEVEPDTFYIEHNDSYRHFFTKDELLAPFSDFQLLHFLQAIGRDPGHPGYPEPHYHGSLTYLGQKPSATN
jgi:SAM-dependent methyltransferase